MASALPNPVGLDQNTNPTSQVFCLEPWLSVHKLLKPHNKLKDLWRLTIDKAGTEEAGLLTPTLS